MIGHAGFDADGADVEGGLFEFFDEDVGWDFFEADGEEGTFHLAGEDVSEAMAGAFVAEYAKAILWFIDGKKKREALNVVPMGVGKEECEFNWGMVELGHELTAEEAQAGAAIEDNDLAIGADFDAGSVAAVADGAWAGSWDGAADAPEFEKGGGFRDEIMPVLVCFSSSAGHGVSFQAS